MVATSRLIGPGSDTAHASIRSASHELTLTLLGLFEVSAANPQTAH